MFFKRRKPHSLFVISGEKSVFPVVVFDSADSWPALLKLAAPHLDQNGLTRLLRVLNGKCQCVVVEKHYIDRDYRDTFSQFHSKRFSTPNARCVRLHFFKTPMTAEAIAVGGTAVQDSYLGYSVLRPTKPNCIGRTLLNHAVRLDAQSQLSICQERVHLLGTRLIVDGFPFISQDADVTVCAQSALWMLLRYYSNRYPNYSEIRPFEITSLANNHASGIRVYPSAGLYSWQLAEALRLQGFAPIVYSRDQFQDNFDHLLYTYIESGLPLLVTVPRHVVVSYGHKSDYTAPAPANPVGFIYSSHFNQSFVISDDNQFPYQMLSKNGSSLHDSKYHWKEIEEFIVPLPERVFLTAEQAQTAIENVLNRSDIGITSSKTLAGKTLLLRLFLTTAQSFKRNLSQRGMGSPTVREVYRNLPMPHFVWICEISLYEDFARDQKVLGEVIWDATRNAYEPDGWIACHLPESLTVDSGSAFNGSQDLKKFPLPTYDPYSLFNSNLHSL